MQVFYIFLGARPGPAQPKGHSNFGIFWTDSARLRDPNNGMVIKVEGSLAVLVFASISIAFREY